MSPRRSSRARTTQPPPSAPPHSSTSSSVSSARDRNARVSVKQQSPRISATPQSQLSSEDGDNAALAPPTQPRRSARGQDINEHEAAKLDNELDDEEEAGDEEEITRCVCGHQDYPGPPSDPKSPPLGGLDPQNDEAGGLFIQCDVCKVWQHGGCVGIMEEKDSPEEYFCEECKRELHKIMTDHKGQRYSCYLPVWEHQHPKHSARKTSLSKDADKNSRDKDKTSGRGSVDSVTKRRSTMNSRAAYEEDEMLRKVIEESKHEGDGVKAENGNRKGKRSRDETSESEAEGETTKTTANSHKQKPRGAAARSQREKEMREAKEREKAELAKSRKARAERRRVGGMSPSPTPLKRKKPTPAVLAESEMIENSPVPKELEDYNLPPDHPSPPKPLNTPKAATPVVPESRTKDKKGGTTGRAPQKRGKLGRNQYTRDRDPPASTPPGSGNNKDKDKNKDASPASQTRATNGADHNKTDSDGTVSGSIHSKNGKTKATNSKLEKTSFNEMRRRASGMLEFISRMQVEMAGEKTTVTTVAGAAVSMTLKVVEGTLGPETKDKGFEQMSSLEMMDHLTRRLVMWQKDFGP
ncbi:Histone deacetylase complex subunit [Coniosporium tulheliwenetii]|uniref:Histone deacetylase complex subunit n=1 Tax=Coniosporium tulheliwenetii TaxID=3383036 RepID=A0ACC2ZDI4_9PEZI|nr:Histone deacetylase complex subunit [Cladosporium sp. JES 115]